MNHLEDILVPLGVFALTFGIVYFAITTKHRERMRMIENGVDPSLFYDKKGRKGLAVKFASLLIGIGVGVVMGNVLDNLNLLDSEVAYPAMVLIFGGVGLLLGNHFANKMNEEDSTN